MLVTIRVRRIAWVVAAGCVVARGEPAEQAPQAYIQSAFTTNDPPSSLYTTYARKKLRAECFSQFFTGVEVLDLNVDTATGRDDVRELATVLRDLSSQLGRRFNGFWSFPRLPGFFWAAHIDSQPADYRAWSLKSNGEVWPRRPSLPEDNESKIKFTGEVLDITHPQAVNDLLANIARVFRWNGPENECVGPLYGYIVLNEWLLSSNYESVWSPYALDRDVDSPDRIMRLHHKTHHGLFVDDDPYYSYLNPPKRGVPLFTPRARDSFVAYAQTHGVMCDKLPADRNEFNDDDTTVHLPDWVEFVSLADTTRWRIWEDWVYETWSVFVERVCREWVLAQQGNSDFKGVLYFQLPMWYSIRASSQRPVTYQYFDENGVLQTQIERLADYAEYDRLNPVVMGQDLDYLMASPYLAGLIHETTKSIPVHSPGSLTHEEQDEYVDNHDRFRHYFMAQGALARRICYEQGKLFGAFARSQFFKDQTHLTPEYFVRGFDRTIGPLKPDIIATIGPWFINRNRVDPKYHDVMPSSTGELQDVWQQKMEEYRARYAAGVRLPFPASEASPADGAVGVRVTATLTWLPGDLASSHDVYFGPDYQDPPYRANVTQPRFDPGPLRPRTAYHFRVDERNDSGVSLGPVWTFVTGGFPGDFDNDDDSDQADFGLLQLCISGDGWMAAPHCRFADLDGDLDVDGRDAVRLLECIDGADRPPLLDCLDD